MASRTAELHAQNQETARLEMETRGQASRLAEAEAFKRALVVKLSHEVKTPLTLVLGALEDVTVAPHDARVPRRIELAYNNARRLGELVVQLLAQARAEVGELRPVWRHVDLVAAVNEPIRRFEADAERRGVNLRFASGAQLGWTDPDYVDKVVTNLVANALTVAPPLSTVTVSVRAEPPGHLTLTVDDAGPGVPVADRERIFEAYVQLAAPGRGMAQGLGLGLSLVRDLVECLGGSVVAEDSPLGGARVRVALPITADVVALDGIPVSEARSSPVLPPPDVLATGTAVLVVEDHADLRAWIAEHVASRWPVIEAADAEMAEDLALRHRPWAIVTDIMLPGRDGLELAVRVRAQLPETRILVVSARGGTGVRARAESVADGFLEKPFSVSDLLTLLDRLSGGSGASGRKLTEAQRLDVARLDSVLDEHMASRTYGVDEIARATGRSVRALERFLQETRSQTPSEWIRERRLRKAHELLAAGAVESVADAAERVGLSRAHFSRVFAAWSGRSASEVLAQARRGA